MVEGRLGRCGRAAVVALVALSGCGAEDAPHQQGRGAIEVVDTTAAPVPIGDAHATELAEPGDTFPGTFQGTAGTVSEARPGQGPSILREVRAGSHGGFDRVVFEFDGLSTPGYHVEYVDRPVRECGSGHEVEIAGQGWLLVRLEPTRAHEFDGERAEVTVADRDRALDLRVIRQLTLICDFEAQVEWVMGVAAPNRYRVIELHEPARLVVDVRH